MRTRNVLVRQVDVSGELLVVIVRTWSLVELVLENAELPTLQLIAYFGRLVLRVLLCHADRVGVVESGRVGGEVIGGMVVRIEDGCRLVLVCLAQQIRLARSCRHQAGRADRYIEEILGMMCHVVRMVSSVHEIISAFDAAVELSGVWQLELSDLRRVNCREGRHRVGIVGTEIALKDERSR